MAEAETLPLAQDRWLVLERTDAFGSLPPLVALPRSEAEAIEVVRFARAHRQTIEWLGGGSKRGLGHAAPPADIGIAFLAYEGVVEYRPRDLVVTVRAGTKMAELQALVGREGQMIAVHVPHPDASTVGGAVSANDAGLLRFRHGAFRDHVLGVRVVSAAGEVLAFGGKVMKNVAGYDMTKLYIGALGTLGGMLEVTFRLRPLPRALRLFGASFAPPAWPDVERFLVELLRAPLEPQAVYLLSPEMAAALGQAARWTLAVVLADEPEAVEVQAKRIAAMLPDAVRGDFQRDGDEAWAFLNALGRSLPKSPPWTAAYRPLREAERVCDAGQRDPGDRAHEAGRPDAEGDAVSFRLGLLSTDVPEALRIITALTAETGRRFRAFGCFGAGVVWAVMDGAHDAGGKVAVQTALRRLRAAFPAPERVVRLVHAPEALRRGLDVWGLEERSIAPMRRVKRALDPDGRFRAGRWFGKA